MKGSIVDLLEIFIVTYNRKMFLQKTLEKVFELESPIRNCKVTILNNASTDGTSEVIESFKSNHQNIVHIQNARNINGNANVAKAYENAEKKYLWVLCDDDEYQWEGWYQVEQAMSDDYDAIVVANYAHPAKGIEHLFKQMGFVAAAIYKSDIITDTVMNNVEFCISTMFPQLALASALINDNKKIFICEKWIVNMVPHEGLESYVKGCTAEDMHPYQSNMFWSVGYINVCQMIKDVRLRKRILQNMSEDLRNEDFYNAMRILVFVNKRHYNGFGKNILDALWGLQGGQKLILIQIFLVSLLPCRVMRVLSLVKKVVTLYRFDSKQYLSKNPDVRKSGMSPLLHYVKYGIFERRSCK